MAAPRRQKPARPATSAASAGGAPNSARTTNRPEASAAAVTYSSGRIRIDGSSASTSRMIPPTQAVITPMAKAGTGATP